MNASENYFKPIDENKLNEAIAKSGMNKTALERSLGHASGYFTKCIQRGKVNISVIATIKALYNIDIEKHERLIKNDESDDDNLELIRKKIGANNLLTKQSNEMLDVCMHDIHDIKSTLHTIGNLLTQINEKMFKEGK